MQPELKNDDERGATTSPQTLPLKWKITNAGRGKSHGLSGRSVAELSGMCVGNQGHMRWDGWIGFGRKEAEEEEEGKRFGAIRNRALGWIAGRRVSGRGRAADLWGILPRLRCQCLSDTRSASTRQGLDPEASCYTAEKGNR